MKPQKTIENEIKVSGKGLFEGKDAKVTFRPAAADTGIVFVRVDMAEPVRIPALASNLADRSRRTALKKGPVTIETTEHCLAAVSALEIDNLIIETSASELPGLDASSAEYVKLLRKAGLVELQTPRKEIIITKPITVTDGDATIYALPFKDDSLSITYDLDYTVHTQKHCELTGMLEPLRE